MVRYLCGQSRYVRISNTATRGCIFCPKFSEEKLWDNIGVTLFVDKRHIYYKSGVFSVIVCLCMLLLILRIGSLDVTLAELIVGFVYCDNQRILPLCTFLKLLFWMKVITTFWLRSCLAFPSRHRYIVIVELIDPSNMKQVKDRLHTTKYCYLWIFYTGILDILM